MKKTTIIVTGILFSAGVASIVLGGGNGSSLASLQTNQVHLAGGLGMGGGIGQQTERGADTNSPTQFSMALKITDGGIGNQSPKNRA